jgi:hypothetical protein
MEIAIDNSIPTVSLDGVSASHLPRLLCKTQLVSIARPESSYMDEYFDSIAWLLTRWGRRGDKK